MSKNFWTLLRPVHSKDGNYNDDDNGNGLIIIPIVWEKGSLHHSYNNNDMEKRY